MFGTAFGGALFVGLMVWALYLALEPLVRRRWPGLIISWTRLLSGNFRDPMVARDFLIGAACGSVILLIGAVESHLPSLLGMAPLTPERVELAPLLGLRYLGQDLVTLQVEAAVNAMFFFFLPIGLLLLVRREWLALVLSVMILGSLGGARGESPLFAFTTAVIQVSAFLFVVRRFGLLAIAATFLYVLGVSNAPLTGDFSAWYGSMTGLVLAIFALPAVLAFRAALPQRKPARS